MNIPNQFCKCGDKLTWEEVQKGQHVCNKCLKQKEPPDIERKSGEDQDGW